MDPHSPHASDGKPRPGRREAVLPALLSAVAGYVDTAGFIGLFGLFTAHVTGNLVTVGSTVARHDGAGTGPRLAMLPIFMCAVAATVLFIRALRARGRPVLTPVLGIEALALVAFLLAGVCLGPRIGPAHEGWLVTVIGATGVIAMGIQNALMREVLAQSAPTTMMTGNVTQFTIDLTRCLFPDKPTDAARRAEARRRLAKTSAILLGFVGGAALGALGVQTLGFHCLAVPALSVCALAVVARGIP